MPPAVPGCEAGLDSIREAVAADIWTRTHRLCGRAARWDPIVADQGAETADEAARLGLAPQEFADQWVERWRARLESVGVASGAVARTSERRHQRVAKALFLKLADRKDIVRGSSPAKDRATAGSSSRASDEGTVGQADRGTEAGEGGGAASDAAPEGYFLRVSKYAKALTRHLEGRPDWVLPAARRDAVLRSVRGPDPCISRPGGGWGLAVPLDKALAVEGWFDELVSHLTASGYLLDPQAFEQAWPPMIQAVAPDAPPGRTAAWLALLMAMGLPFPERLLVRGRLIWHDEAAEADAPGGEPLRYALARAADLGADGSLSLRGIAELWRAEVVGFLRLVDQALAAAESACGGRVPCPGPFGPAEEPLIGAAAGLFSEIGRRVESLDLRAALEAVRALAARTADYAAGRGLGDPLREPRTAKGFETSVYAVLEVCRLIAGGLRPFLPAVAAAVLDRLGVAEDQRLAPGHAQWGLLRPMARLPQGVSLESRFARPGQD